MNELFYEGSKWKIGNPIYHLYMCSGQRSRGKTTFWVGNAIDRCLKYIENGDENHKFVYLRRSEEDMKRCLSKGFLNPLINSPKYRYIIDTYDLEEKDGVFTLINKSTEDKVVVGYYMTLNTTKGVSIEDADVILFDEYIEVSRAKYKGGCNGVNEPDLFARLLETIFRRRDFWCILLANNDTSANPYHDYFGVPYGAKLLKDKNKTLWYEFDYSEKTAELKNESTLGKMFSNTRYLQYSNGIVSMDEVDPDLICPIPSQATQTHNVKIYGKLMTLWYDKEKNIQYVTDKRKFNPNCQVMSVTTSDMSIDTNFMAYNSVFLEVQRILYGKGRVRFENQSVASIYSLMLKIQ